MQVTAGTPSKPLLKDVTPDNRVPVIRSQRSALSDLLEGEVGVTFLPKPLDIKVLAERVKQQLAV